MGPILIFFGILVFSAHLFSFIFKKRKVPDVLLLMIIGLIIGPILNLVDIADMGKMGPLFASVTLMFILFESGTEMSIKTLKENWKSIAWITTLSFVLSAFVVGFIGWEFLDLSFNAALLLGTILGGTAAAVAVPLARQLDLQESTKTILILEAAINSVLCIVVSLAFIETFKYGSLDVFKVVGKVVSSFVMATAIGIAGGIVWASLLDKVRKIQNSMFLTPAFVFIIYGISESLEFSGAISALAFGIMIANPEYFEFSFLKKYQKRGMHKLNDGEKSFFSEVVFLFKTFFFVYIGVSIPFNDITAVGFGVIITLSLFLMRSILTHIVIPKKAKAFDKFIVSTMVPKGLAAAVLATIPEQEGIPGGEVIKNIIYSVIFISIIFTSVLILLSDHFPKVRAISTFLFRAKGKTEETAKETDSEQQAEDNDTSFPQN